MATIWHFDQVKLVDVQKMAEGQRTAGTVFILQVGMSQ